MRTKAKLEIIHGLIVVTVPPSKKPKRYGVYDLNTNTIHLKEVDDRELDTQFYEVPAIWRKRRRYQWQEKE